MINICTLDLFFTCSKMSDVAEGGATAFPMLKRAVLPKKGTAVFWWNLHASGERDLRTKHAGCPVLVGNKWSKFRSFICTMSQ